MKITDIDVDKILCVSVFSGRDEEDHDEGFLKKLFGKKNKDAESFYESKIKDIGVDFLREELTGDVIAFKMDNAADAPCVVLTDNYLIIEGHDVITISDIEEFGLRNLAYYDPGLFQFATDRIGIPYDPSFVSEYEGEEGYELGRFTVRLLIRDEYGQDFTYDIPMDIEDRREFCKAINESWAVCDISDEDCLEGKFVEDPSVVEDDLDLAHLLGDLLGISPVVPEEYDGDEDPNEE